MRVPHNPRNGRVFRSLRRAQDILGVVAAVQPAKTAAAVIELLNGSVQVSTGKVRPQNVHFHQLCISGLPQHEVGQTLFSAGPQDKVRVLLPGGVHGIAEHLLSDLFRLQLPGCGLFRQLLRGPHDLRAAAVVDGNVQGHAGLDRRFSFQLVHQLLQLLVQHGAVAHEFDADVAVLVVKSLQQVFAEQPHDGVHFFQRALPVLGGKGIEVHRRNAQLVAVVRDIAEHLGAFFVPGGAGQAPVLGPAAIAVHDDADGQPLRKLSGMCHLLLPAALLP